MAEYDIGKEVGGIVLKAIGVAYGLYKAFRDRQDTRGRFAKYIGHVHVVLKDLKDVLPERAAPVATDMVTQLERGQEKCSKYEARSGVEGFLRAKSEAEKLSLISDQIEQLLALLTASASASNAISEAVSDLQRQAAQLQSTSQQAHTHLACMSTTLQIITDESAKSADVDVALRQLQGAMLEVGGQAARDVQRACSEVLRSLSKDIGTLMLAVDQLQGSVEEMAADLQKMQVGLEDLGSQVTAEAHLTREGITELHSGMASMEASIIAAICSITHSPQQPGTSDVHTFRGRVRELMKAVREGRVRLPCCFVKFLPFSTEGELVPMRLPCGCTMSRAASRVAAESGTCQLCYDSVPDDTDIEVDRAVLRVVQAERRGVSVPDIQRSRVTLGEWIGEGAQGTVQKGELASQDGSKQRDVAVKVVRVPDSVQRKDVGALDQVVATTYLASSHSPHVCKMHGVSWTEQDCWLMLELCEGTLTSLLNRATQEQQQRGLPVMDVLVLGIALTDATLAVHEFAHSLHLDIKPDNVLLRPPRKRQGHEGIHVPVLTDFGLMHKLPSRVQESLPAATSKSLVSGVAAGTPGYAAPEQSDGKGGKKSDVYSIGATLVFAASYERPFGKHATSVGIAKQLLQGEQMAVPDKVPAELAALLRRMVAIPTSARPSLREVYSELLRLHGAYKAAGHTARYLRTVWGIPSRAPTQYTDNTLAGIGTSQPVQRLSPPAAALLAALSPSPNTADASDVQDLFQKLSAADSGTRWTLNHRTVASSEVPGHAATPAWLHAEDITVSQKLLSHENKKSGLYSLVPPAAHVAVHVLKGSGKKLSSGVLELAPSSCIVLGPDCRDAEFEDIEFKGGSVVCTGAGCTASFTNVKFHACTLVVRNGTQVTLQEPSFADMAAAAAGLSIFAHGEGTTVHVQGGCIEGGTQGATVQAGAQLDASGLDVTKVDVSGLQLQGKTSQLLLTACKVHGLLPCRLNGFYPPGVLVQAGGSAKLKECHISQCGHGVEARHEGSKLEVKGCALQRNEDCGVIASDAAEVVVRGCHSTDNGCIGFHASHKATLTASDCSASRCSNAGFGVVNGACAVLEKCTAATNSLHGVYAGCPGSRLEAEGCTFQMNARSGVQAADAAQVVLRGCHSTDNGFFGFEADTKATLTASLGCVRGNRCGDCKVYSGGRLEMQRVEVGGIMTTSTLGTYR